MRTDCKKKGIRSACHMRQPLCLILICAATAVAAAAISASPDEAVATALKLWTAYNKDVRPPPDNGTANVIKAHINLNSLVGVNSASQEITLLMWLTLSWTDQRLSWLGRFNSSLDCVEAVYLPNRLLWKPDVSFYDLLQVQQVSCDNAVAHVSSTGAVMQSTQFVTTTKCPMDMFAFPYDAQSCRVFISSVIHPKRALALRIGSYLQNDSITKYLARSDEFCITGASIEKSLDEYFDVVEFVINFKRRPTFYALNLILPSILLLAISTLTFRLPPECGERVSFSITIVLSMCVFLQMVNEYTPTQSESVPLLTCYCSVAVVMTMTIVLGNAFVLNCHFKHLGGTRVGNRVIRALFLNSLLARWWPKASSAAESASLQSGRSRRSLGDVASSPMDGGTGCHGNEWSIVVAVADCCLFAFYFGVTVAIVIALIIIEVVNSGHYCING